MRARNAPDSAPWMIRWSYVEVKVTTLLIARRESVAGAEAANSAGYSMAPVAMMAPWPGISRGTDAVVPSVPGIGQGDRRALEVRRSAVCPARARATTSSEAARNCAKFSFSAPFTLGTRRERVPSAFGDVDRDAEADLLAPHARGLATRRVERVVHDGEGLDRLDDRPGDRDA